MTRTRHPFSFLHSHMTMKIRLLNSSHCYSFPLWVVVSSGLRHIFAPRLLIDMLFRGLIKISKQLEMNGMQIGPHSIHIRMQSPQNHSLSYIILCLAHFSYLMDVNDSFEIAINRTSHQQRRKRLGEEERECKKWCG